MEFEDAIREDLKTLEIYPDFSSHTSDHFDYLEQVCEQVIREGTAYVDATPVELVCSLLCFSLSDLFFPLSCIVVFALLCFVEWFLTQIETRFSLYFFSTFCLCLSVSLTLQTDARAERTRGGKCLSFPVRRRKSPNVGRDEERK